jgi:hybrid cluster-associated redox disulfide protein
LFKSEESIRSLRAELEETSTRLRLELLMRTGGAQFSPEMTVREAMLLHPLSEQVLAGFHLGGCSSCAVAPDDTLAAICRGHGVDETELLANLNGLLKGANGAGLQQPIKAPNIHLDVEI